MVPVDARVATGAIGAAAGATGAVAGVTGATAGVVGAAAGAIAIKGMSGLVFSLISFSALSRST